tara:strand:- start:55 stop:342 length:288 start_codon:yes stop_codon:yes gene_type:complete
MLTIITNLENLRVKTNTEKRTIKAVKNRLGFLVSNVVLDKTFDQLGFEAVEIVDVLLAVEDEFDIDLADELFDDGIMVNITLADIVKIIDKELER